MKLKEIFDIDQTIAKDIFEDYEYPWEVLPNISSFIIELGEKLDKEKFEKVKEDVWIAKSAHIDKSASIIGPAIIDENAEIRHCAFIRGKAIVGKNVVVGNSTELKNCILFNDVKVPHFNYVGDSILGYKSHLGAGTIISNVKSDKTNVKIEIDEKNERIDTKLKKCGAFLGDFVEVGCNSVLNPGTIVCRNTNIYPLSCVRGFIKENSIYKSENNIITKF